MPTARIQHPDGSVDTFEASKTEEMYEFEEVDIASVYADRTTIKSIDYQNNLDWVFIEDPESDQDLFGGVLRDVIGRGGKSELLVDSFEQLAMDAEPSAGGVRYHNANDRLIIYDSVDAVDDLSRGTIDLTGVTTFIFSYATPAKRIRTVAEATGMEVRYNADRTVDYTVIGDDRTEGIRPALSPANQNIDEKFDPDWQGGNKNVTHLVMLGAGEGEAQRTAVVVPETDPYDYEGDDKFSTVRRYAADDWFSGDHQAWDSRVNKRVTDEETLADQGEVLIGEFNAEYLDVDTVVVDHYVNLGDTWTLRHPEEGVDHDLRAAKVRRVIDNDGVKCYVTFSNRRLTRRSDSEKIIDDVDNYNMAFEGTAVMPTASSGRQPVGQDQQGNDVVCDLGTGYPAEVVYEHRVDLHVKGGPYRAYSWGAEDNDVQDSVAQEGHDYNLYHGVETGNELALDTTFDVTVPTSEVRMWAVVTNTLQSDKFVFVEPEMHNEATGERYPGPTHEVRLDPGTQVAVSMADPTDCEGQWFRFRVGVGTIDQVERGPANLSMDQGAPDVQMSSIDYNAQPSIGLQAVWQAIGKHQHPVEPGVLETFGDSDEQYHPSNCGVLVNGREVATIPGGEPFTETIDLRGELRQGDWNDIEITSDTLGAVQAHLDTDVTREILGDG